jgi:uncharacterized protein YjbJ (UPF0337 family)
MSLMDKIRNKLDQSKGMAKESTGRAIGNEQMQYEGKMEQAKANARQSGEHLRDAATNVRNAFHQDVH